MASMNSIASGVICAMVFASTNAIASDWTIEEDFEGYRSGESCSLFSASQSIATTNVASEGEKSCRLSIDQGSTGFGQWGGIVDTPDLTSGDEIWIRLKMFVPNGFDYNSYGEGNHLKFLRIRTESASGQNQGYNDWYINREEVSVPHKFIFEGEQIWREFGDQSDKIVRGTWEVYEMYVRLDDTPVSRGGTARVRTWKNGELLGDITDLKTLVNDSSIATSVYIFTYWNGSAPRTQSLYIDELTITSQDPGNRDVSGNPFIGMGATTPAPKAPIVR